MELRHSMSHMHTSIYACGSLAQTRGEARALEEEEQRTAKEGPREAEEEIARVAAHRQNEHKAEQSSHITTVEWFTVSYALLF
jgi:hypothetical protein